MAELRLDRHEAELGYFPAVCMRCGMPAATQQKQQFRQSGVSQETKSWVIAPLCGAHRHHWRGRAFAVPLVLLGWLVLSCAGLFALGKDNAGVAFILSGVAFLGWIVLAIVLHYTSIHARTITPTDVILRGVAPEFMEALAAHRQSPKAGQPLVLEGGGLARDQIRLTAAELKTELPRVCLRCGDPATDWRHRAHRVPKSALMASNVAGIALLATVGVGWISTSRGELVEYRAPVCRRHRNHWLWRQLGIPLSMLAVPLTGVALVALAPRDYMGWACVASCIVACGWVVFGMYMSESMIQPLEIRAEALTLKGVSEKFVQAMEQRRRESLGNRPVFPPPKS